MRCWIILLLLSVVAPAAAQLSPPGLDEAVTASWQAAGIRQDLDPKGRRQSMTYVGLGLVSEHASAPDQFAIFVLNQEFHDAFSKHFTYSYAISLRRQNSYSLHDPRAVHRDEEVRFYSRFSNVLHAGRLKLTSTVRPELRTFYTTSLGLAESPPQLRFRFREQAAVKVDKRGAHRVVGSAELLTSVAKEGGNWDDFGYRESRFCLYWSLDRDTWPVVLDVGYMNNLLGRGEQLADVHYLALDVIWKNPFGKPAVKPREYLE